MTSPRILLSRRRLLIFGGLFILLSGLAMLHPYPRQSLFGPTIRGEPWCVWESKLRRQFGTPRDSYLDKLQTWFGAERPKMSLDEAFDHPEMLPLIVSLLDDDDLEVRDTCVNAITWFPCLRNRSAAPALRKLLEDHELEVRVMAMHALWLIEKDEQLLAWLAGIMNHADPEARYVAMRHAVGLSAETPMLFPAIAARVKDPHRGVRSHVMNAMIHFGKKGVPILIAGMSDEDATVRYSAVLIAKEIGADAKDAIPTLEARLQDADTDVVYAATLALRAIDPDRPNPLKK